MEINKQTVQLQTMSTKKILGTTAGYRLFNAPAASPLPRGATYNYETAVHAFSADGFDAFAERNFHALSPPPNANCIVNLKLIQYDPAHEKNLLILKSIGKSVFYYGNINNWDVEILPGKGPTRKGDFE